MSDALKQFHEDRELRDAARTVLLADIEHARATLSGKGVAARMAGRIGDGAKDVFEVAKVNADDNRGVLAGLIGAILLWIARGPIMEMLGFEQPQAPLDEDTDTSEALDLEPELNESDTDSIDNQPSDTSAAVSAAGD
ncbi:MAG: hypothetical protein AAF127_01335 [Pseudomonadota bacterium]